jgi:hypothetical protein
MSVIISPSVNDVNGRLASFGPRVRQSTGQASTGKPAARKAAIERGM